MVSRLRACRVLSLFLALSLLGCEKSTHVTTSAGSATLVLSGPQSIVTSTCTLFTVRAAEPVGASGAQVYLVGLGNGSAYGSREDCVADKRTLTAQIPAGATSVDFYFRDDSAESFTLAATATTNTASLGVSVSSLQVLGAPNGSELFQVAQGLSQPKAAWVAGGKLFVADSSNNRVLVWNQVPTTTGQRPDFALGQPDLYTTTANGGGLSAASLSGPTFVYSDGTRLFVADTNNNRVLVWSALPSHSGQPASVVLGQPSFGANACNNGGVTDHTLCAPSAVHFDGTNLYVADTGNHRVLAWTGVPSTSGASAAYVIGQASFTVGTSGNANTQLSSPGGVFVAASLVFISEKGNHRVTAWPVPAAGVTETASLVLGQTAFGVSTANTGGISAATMNSPTQVFSDGTQLYVADANNNRILVWSAIPVDATAAAAGATFAIGQTAMNASSSSQLYRPLGVITANGQVFVSDTSDNRILVYAPVPTALAANPSAALGQPNLTSRSANTTVSFQNTMNYPGAAFTDGTHLFVADTNNHRVLVWSSLPTSDGQPPDFVLGQPDLATVTPNTGGISASSMNRPASVCSDGTRLFVSDTGNHRILVWDTIPAASGHAATLALGQVDLTTANAGTGQNQLRSPAGIHCAPNKLFVADAGNHRVLFWNGSLDLSKNLNAALVLGQTSFTTMTPGTSATAMWSPSDVNFDGTRLFVADTGNNRVLVWTSLPSSTRAADLVLGQPDFTTRSSGTTQALMSQPGGVYSDGTHLFVADSGNNRILEWRKPPTASQALPDGVLGQSGFTSSSTSLTAVTVAGPQRLSGDGCRLFVADANNSRVVVFPYP